MLEVKSNIDHSFATSLASPDYAYFPLLEKHFDHGKPDSNFSHLCKVAHMILVYVQGLLVTTETHQAWLCEVAICTILQRWK